MTKPSTPSSADSPHPEVDADLQKGAVEAPEGMGDQNAPALDESGMPNDEVAIAQDVIGANEDKTQG